MSEGPAQAAQAEDPAIRPMRRDEIDLVVDVDRHAFRSAWPREVFEQELERPFAHVDLLRDEAGRVVAFINYWLVRDEVHVLHVATHIDARGRGYASRLMRHVVRFAERHGCGYVQLEVRRSNLEAIRLYRKHSFRAVGVRPRYYADDHEDAIVMVLELAARA